MYFQFDKNEKSVPVNSRPGYWYIASAPYTVNAVNVLGNPNYVRYVTRDTKLLSEYKNGVDLCPNEPLDHLWNGEDIRETANASSLFICKPKRPLGQVATCDKSKWIYHGPWNSKNEEACRLDEVVNSLIRTQVQQLIHYRPDSENVAESYVTEIKDAIVNLAKKNCMRIIDENGAKFVETGCSKVCDHIKDIENPRGINEAFSGIMKVFYGSITTWSDDYQFCHDEYNKLKISINKFNPFTGIKV